MNRWWDVTFFDDEVVTSEDCSLDNLPTKPITVIAQTGDGVDPKRELLVSGHRFYFDTRYGWCEMDNDTESLVTKLRIEVKHWICYRPGWWEPEFASFDKRRYAAADRLKAHKDAS